MVDLARSLINRKPISKNSRCDSKRKFKYILLEISEVLGKSSWLITILYFSMFIIIAELQNVLRISSFDPYIIYSTWTVRRIIPGTLGSIADYSRNIPGMSRMNRPPDHSRNQTGLCGPLRIIPGTVQERPNGRFIRNIPGTSRCTRGMQTKINFEDFSNM